MAGDFYFLRGCNKRNIFERDFLRQVHRDRKLIERIVELTEENNKILRQMRRANRFSYFFTFIKWLIIIGSAVGAYYYLEPYLTPLMEFYQKLPLLGQTVDLIGNLNVIN